MRAVFEHMKARFLLTGVATVLTAGSGLLPAADADFNLHIKPILESACISCHRADKASGGYRMDVSELAFKGGEKGVSVVPGNPAKSPLYTSTVLPPDHDDIMPPKGDKLTKGQAELLKNWIEQGAKWPAGAKLEQVRRVSFVKDIQPILEFNCVACHKEGHDKGKLRLDTRELAFKGGDGGAGIVAFQPEKSPLYTTTILSADDDALMPPKAKNGPMAKETTDLLRDWIRQGAVWPDGLVLTPKKKEEAGGDEVAVVAGIHARILSRLDVKDAAAMKPYTMQIPGTDVNYDMLPIPAGTFVMGSSEGEKGRKPDEGPTHKVSVEPFWMGKTEVTWNEYELFMYPDAEKRMSTGAAAAPDTVSDGVSRPTKPYVEMSFGMGKDGFPAISMTQHAANKYCQWLSAKTGQFYRLPTEAEWEYACRAGTTTAYSWGDDPAVIKEYAWFVNNSDFQYKKVGKKKPNPWGLHDMHGNVAEWCLDQYEPGYAKFKDAVTQNPWIRQTTPYGHVVRGGSWDDEAPLLRSAGRRFSDKSWKQQDPQLPKSIWYLTDAQFLGFRVVRPLKVPPAEELQRYWNNGVEKE
jgi:formylglycine-generating enzyme required for sulfatase activity/mono/diheme cytochrome c family protein